MTRAGPAIPVVLASSPPSGGPALRVQFVADGRPTEAGPARPLYIVSDNRPVQGNEPVPVVLSSGNGFTLAEPPMPIYDVGGLLVFERLKQLAAGGLLYDGISAFTGAAGAIASWPPVIGANAAAQATPGNRPIVGTLNGKPAAVFDGLTQYLQTAAFAQSFSPPYTVLCVYQRTGATGGVSRVIHDGIASGNRAALLHQGSNDNVQARGSAAIGGNMASSLNPAITRVVYNGAASRIYLNGVADLVGDTGTAVLTGLTLGVAFNGSTGAFPGSIGAYVLIAGAADGDARAIEAERLLQLRFGFQLTQVFGVGNSLMAGDWMTIACTTASTTLGRTVGTPISNLGIGGQSVATMIQNAPAAVRAAYLSGHPKHMILVEGGVVDDGGGMGATYDVIYARLATLCQLLRQIAPVGVCTAIDAQGSGPRWHTSYLQLNTLLRAGYTGFADRLIDFGADPRLQNAADLTYFNLDQVHPNTAGKAVQSEIAAPIIAQLAA